MAGLIGASLLYLHPVCASPSRLTLPQQTAVPPFGFLCHRHYPVVLTTSSYSSKRIECVHNKKLKSLSKHGIHSFHHKRSSSSTIKLGTILAAPLVYMCFSSSTAISLTMNMVSSDSFHPIQALPLADLNPSLANLLIHILGPLFTSFNFLFIIRIVMSWYPQLPVYKFPYVIAFAPTEPVLEPTRKLIPPVGGVDVSPVIWVALMSFVNEILLGQQGLLVLLSQQQT